MCPKNSLGSQVSGRGSTTRDSGLGTRDDHDSRPRQLGFSIVTAIFLIVVLALLGVFIVSVSGIQQSSQALDVQGVRA